MEQNLVKVKDLYQPPKYECIEVSIATFNPQSWTEVIVEGSPSVSTILSFDNTGMSINPDEIKKAYLPVLPTDDFSTSRLNVKAVTDKGEFITVLPITASETLKRFHPGSYCIFNLRKTKTGMTVGMEIQGWEDGEIVDIPVF